jgi:hypothetical protein
MGSRAMMQSGRGNSCGAVSAPRALVLLFLMNFCYCMLTEASNHVAGAACDESAALYTPGSDFVGS